MHVCMYASMPNVRMNSANCHNIKIMKITLIRKAFLDRQQQIVKRLMKQYII